MLTVLLILLPLAGALIAGLLKGKASGFIAVLFSVVQLALTVYMIFAFVPDASVQFSMRKTWISSLGIEFYVGVDGISIIMLLLTNLLMPLILLSANRQENIQRPAFYALALLMQAGLVGVFASLDAFLYYIFWELALIPIFFIMILWGQKNSQRVTLKFFIYTLLGSLFMLAGIILVYIKAGQHSFSVETFHGSRLGTADQQLIFWLFFAAYAIKIPIFPLHTWQPSAYTSAPAAGTMLLSGIMLKMGLYSLLRWLLPVTSIAAMQNSNLIIILCLVGIVYGGWIAVNQQNLKTLFAYSSLSHVGLIAAGIFAMNMQGIQGSLIQMLSHGINVVGLFYIADIIYSQTGTLMVRELGGLRLKAPHFAGLFMIILFGSVALPLTNGFIGEFMLLFGLFDYNHWVALLAGTTIIIGAVYMLKMYQHVALGEGSGFASLFSEVSPTDKMILIPIAAMVILAGIYPMPLIELSEASVARLLETISANSIAK
jgi:NADH-quinone oxidoreductase subunit M